MMIDDEIRRAINRNDIVLDPFCERLLGPCSIGLRLGDCAYRLESDRPVDVSDGSTYPDLREVEFDSEGLIPLSPGELLLVPTMERISLCDHYAGVIDGTSDLARLGISVALSALVAPGFGKSDPSVLTLELTSHSPSVINLLPEMRICKLMIYSLSGKPSRTHEDRKSGYSGYDDVSSSELNRNIDDIYHNS